MKTSRAFQAADEGHFDLEAIVAALSGRFAVAAGAKQLVRRARLDTFDRRLYAAGLTLEHQTVASQERLVLSHLDGSSTVAVRATKLRWPALADVLPAGPVRDAVAPVAGIRALMVTSDEKRRMRGIELSNEDGKTVARLELNEPAVGADAADSRLTVNTLRGYDKQGRRAMRLLADFGLQAVRNGSDRGHDKAPPTVGIDREAPASELLTSALDAHRVKMRDNLPGLLDNVDTEFLHDFRVAVRKTRATLKLGRPCLPETMRSRWEPAFKELGDLTTPVRDLDVYELDLPTMAGWLVAADPADLEPFAAHLRSRRTAKRRALVRGLKSAKFRKLMTDWEAELAEGLAQHDDQKHLSAGQLADRGIARAYKRVVRGGAAISTNSPAEDLHSLRKECKELRYVLEVRAPVLPKAPRKRAVAELKGLQDVLGRFQDSEVQRRALHGFAAEQDRARREFDGAFAHFVRPSSRRLMQKLGGQS
ncbi:MAG: CHAD domain-containing protein [Actinomycetota bacterium]|nr:CHAD domain-containing protein [Actinomycetota bacterium]